MHRDWHIRWRGKETFRLCLGSCIHDFTHLGCHLVVCTHWLATCGEWYFPLAGSSYFWHDDGSVCGGLLLPYPSAQAAPESRRLQNSIRLRTECRGDYNRHCADDRSQAPRASFDVHYRTIGDRKLAVGKTPSTGLGSENIDRIGSCLASLIQLQNRNGRSA